MPTPTIPTAVTEPRRLPDRRRAIVQHHYGRTPGVWRLEELDVPRPGRGEVLVRIHAAAIDRGTWHLMAGAPLAVRLAFGLRGPRQPVPGLDAAGEVVAVGPGVTRLGLGDVVHGIVDGSLSELAIGKERRLVPVPVGVDPIAAAASPVSGLAAYHGLCRAGRLRAGQRVLVVGASGGVGSFAVQIAAALGGHVTGVCSAAKGDAVTGLGAERVVAYDDPAAEWGDEYDLILDVNGNRPLREMRRLLTKRGTFVVAGGEGNGRLFGVNRQLRALAMSPFVAQRMRSFVSSVTASGLEQLGQLLTDGLRPLVERTYPLTAAPTAMSDLIAGRARGKLVVVP